MKSNFLLIVCSGASISLLGLFVLLAPLSIRTLITRNIECFLTIPPISVASYIFVIKYHDKFQERLPPLGAMLNKTFQGAMASFVFFFIMAIISSFLYRIFFMLKK